MYNLSSDAAWNDVLLGILANLAAAEDHAASLGVVSCSAIRVSVRVSPLETQHSGLKHTVDAVGCRQRGGIGFGDRGHICKWLAVGGWKAS